MNAIARNIESSRVEAVTPADKAAFAAAFPNRPFALKHQFAGNPLFALDRIVDLVSSGATLKANGLVEVEHIADITSRLIVNRTALKTRSEEISYWVEKFREACSAS